MDPTSGEAFAGFLASIDALTTYTNNTLNGLRELSEKYSDGAKLVQNLVVDQNSIYSSATQLQQWTSTRRTIFSEHDLLFSLRTSFEQISQRARILNEQIAGLVEKVAAPTGHGIFKKKHKLASLWEQEELESHHLEGKWQAQALQLVLSSVILPPLERRRRLNLFVKRADVHYTKEGDPESFLDDITTIDVRPGSTGANSFGAKEEDAIVKRMRGWSVSRTPFEPNYTPPLLQSVHKLQVPSPSARPTSASSTAPSTRGSTHGSSSFSLPSPNPSTAPFLHDRPSTSSGSRSDLDLCDLELVQKLISKAQKNYADGNLAEGAKGYQSALGMATTNSDAEDVGLDAFSIAEQWAALRLLHSEWEGIEAVLQTLFDRVGHDQSTRLLQFHEKYNHAMLKKANELFRAEKYSAARKICKIVSSILDKLYEAGFDIEPMRIEVNFTWANILLYDTGLDKVIQLMEPIIAIEPASPEDVYNVNKAHDMTARAYFLKHKIAPALHHAQIACTGLKDPTPQTARLYHECISLLVEIHTVKHDSKAAKAYRDLLPADFLPFLWNPNDISTFRLQMLLVRPALSSALNQKDSTTLRAILSWDIPQYNSRGESWAHTLARKDCAQALSLLLSRPDINPNIRMTATGATPLHIATSYSSSKSIPILLSRPDLDVNAVDTKGRTPLLLLLTRGPNAAPAQTTILHRLLAVPGIRVNLQDEDGNTPLHEAFRRGNVDAIRVLLARRDINPRLRDKGGSLAVELAAGERLRAEYGGYFRD